MGRPGCTCPVPIISRGLAKRLRRPPHLRLRSCGLRGLRRAPRLRPILATLPSRSRQIRRPRPPGGNQDQARAAAHAAAATRRTRRTAGATLASVEPPPARTLPPARNPEMDSGSKRGVVLFAPNATDPSVSALRSVKPLANDLSEALAGGASRVQLLAFGGPPGEKSSNTRRLSLKRALVVRQILIDDGVPSERIDVRALGGTDDDGRPTEWMSS